MTTDSSKQSRAKKFGLLVFSLLFTFGFLECATRILNNDIVMFPRYHTSAHYGDYTIRRMRPNSNFQHRSVDGEWNFVINEQGYRNRVDFRRDKPPGVYRILTIGDSHTQGYEVDQDETFSVVLEKFLDDSGMEVEVYNTGVSGYSTAEGLIFLEQEGRDTVRSCGL